MFVITLECCNVTYLDYLEQIIEWTPASPIRLPLGSLKIVDGHRLQLEVCREDLAPHLLLAVRRGAITAGAAAMRKNRPGVPLLRPEGPAANLAPVSNDAAATRLAGWTLGRTLRPIASGPVRRNRIDCTTIQLPCLRKNRAHVGRKGTLQGLRCHQRIITMLVAAKHGAIHKQSLCIGADDLYGTAHQAFNWIGNVVRLVQHIGRRQGRRLALLGVDQLIKDEKQSMGID